MEQKKRPGRPAGTKKNNSKMSISARISPDVWAWAKSQDNISDTIEKGLKILMEDEAPRRMMKEKPKNILGMASLIGGKGEAISIGELRKLANMEKNKFDGKLRYLIGSGQVHAHTHAHPAIALKEDVIRMNGKTYCTIVIK